MIRRYLIKPFSNWQGPVWPVANYLYHIGLKHYGFEKEIAWMAETLGTLLLNDIREQGSMHVNGYCLSWFEQARCQ
jgi:alpha,alpha-trehalase